MADTDDQSKAGANEGNDAPPIETQEPESNATIDTSETTGNKFQQAVAAWRSLDLTKLVSNLDTTAEEMVNQQKESLVKRKDLAQKTKDFRKLDDTAKLAEMKDLLKAYQGYIDVLTTHNKTVSSAFMQAYSPLSEAPDPYPLLEASIDSLITADEVVPKLESENERLQQQVTTLNTQLEETEKQLEDEITKRQSSEGSQDSRIKEVEESWSAVLKEKEDNWTAKEQNLEEKVENQERLLRELKASYEVSQRLEKSGEDAQYLGRNQATAAELEIVSSELERANTRLADIEARNEQLRLELAQSASQSNTARSTAVEDDPAFLRLRSENSSLLRRLDSARFDRDADKTKLETKLRNVEREITSLKASRDALDMKVQKWSDYDEVKRELEMLRAIEFSSIDDVEDDGTTTTGSLNGTAAKSKEESLEQLLVARNKKISNELTELRVSHQDLQRRFERLQEDLSSTNMDLEKARMLNATLENDLQKTQQEASNAFETMSVAGTWTSRYPKSNYGNRRGGPGAGTSPTSSIIGGFEGAGSGGGSNSPRFPDPSSNGPGAGILPMVTAQRDRFKKKISELEAELQDQYRTVTSLRSEVASLQKDNLNLYEKTRYVSSYARGPSSGGAAYNSESADPTSPGVDNVSGIEQYRSAYESNLSPFAAFRSRETARAMKRLNVLEKGVFHITRLVLATRYRRNLFAMYCVGLHMLLFFMLFGGATGVERVTPGLEGLTTGSGGGGRLKQQGFDAAADGLGAD
ncbi:Golgi membrane protein (Coy1) [Zymoseptoria brevis]|uniref:Protein CASP n=1 Tax=Zymoseptoria brevis TaxID=1047168 RepID=A0A0F4GTK4_9PEZI|nr:Golgi membrane protein (Coy1) [Zymoseptoria brevis]